MKLLLFIHLCFLTTFLCAQRVDSLIHNYNWTTPSQIYELPKSLKEISGLTVLNDSLIGCIEDEHGFFYVYNINTKKLEKEIPFGEDGDYEGVTSIVNSIYILRSDGELFKIENYIDKKPKIQHFSCQVPAQDNEGICYDPISKKLLIACKGKFGKGLVNQYRREIHLYDVMKNKVIEKPLFTINIDSVIAFANKKEIKLPIKTKNDSTIQVMKMRMSGIAIHPTTKDIYILSAFDDAVFIFSQKGELKHLQLLDPILFPQAEGIDFLPNGDLLISNEGKEVSPTIVRLSSAPINTNLKQKKNETDIDANKSNPILTKNYFDFDEVDHYYNNYDPLSEENRYDRKFIKTKLDSLEVQLIYGSTPTTINDLEFIPYLNKISYKKTNIDTSLFAQLNEIFTERIYDYNTSTRCIYIYRDILIFKKNKEVVGVVKICFECKGIRIVGTTANTSFFGMEDEYTRLEKLLRK